MPIMVCPECGFRNPAAAARCHRCPHEFSHRDCYPEQYAHPMVGAYVEVCTSTGHRTAGKVERVVPSRFGPLVHLEGGGNQAWRKEDCTPV